MAITISNNFYFLVDNKFNVYILRDAFQQVPSTEDGRQNQITLVHQWPIDEIHYEERRVVESMHLYKQEEASFTFYGRFMPSIYTVNCFRGGFFFPHINEGPAHLTQFEWRLSSRPIGWWVLFESDSENVD